MHIMAEVWISLPIRSHNKTVTIYRKFEPFQILQKSVLLWILVFSTQEYIHVYLVEHMAKGAVILCRLCEHYFLLCCCAVAFQRSQHRNETGNDANHMSFQQDCGSFELHLAPDRRSPAWEGAANSWVECRRRSAKKVLLRISNKKWKETRQQPRRTR